MTTSDDCSVCSEPLTALRRAECSTCYTQFHLNQRMDQTDPECGQVWISDVHLGLEFGCNTCLEEAAAEGGLDDVLDLAEAAAVAGVVPAELAMAAELGQVHHRKTSGGVYLFERKDVVGFRGGA
jgi:hypothetical protein